MEHKQKESSSNLPSPDLELVDAAISFIRAAQKHPELNKPVAGASIRPDGSLWDYAVGLAHAAMEALGGVGPVRDITRSSGVPENVRLESSLQELIDRRNAYVRRH